MAPPEAASEAAGGPAYARAPVASRRRWGEVSSDSDGCFAVGLFDYDASPTWADWKLKLDGGNESTHSRKNQ